MSTDDDPLDPRVIQLSFPAEEALALLAVLARGLEATERLGASEAERERLARARSAEQRFLVALRSLGAPPR